MNINFFVNYFTHALILFTFLSILFVFYISGITKNAYNNEILHLIDNIPMPKSFNIFSLIPLADAKIIFFIGYF
jgi:hypothetical protein